MFEFDTSAEMERGIRARARHILPNPEDCHIDVVLTELRGDGYEFVTEVPDLDDRIRRHTMPPALNFEVIRCNEPCGDTTSIEVGERQWIELPTRHIPALIAELEAATREPTRKWLGPHTHHA